MAGKLEDVLGVFSHLTSILRIDVLRLKLNSKEVLNEVLLVFICGPKRSPPGIEDRVEILICVLLLEST